MNQNNIPDKIPNWIKGEETDSASGEYFSKLSPHTGQEICKAARSGAEDVQNAVDAAGNAQAAWAELTPVQRGEVLYTIARDMRKYREEIAATVALETGMSFGAALGETGGAIAQVSST